MRTQHFLLLGSIALSSPALAAESKSTTHANIKPEGGATAGAARSTAANDDWMRGRPACKNRVYYTFPPSAKRM